MRAKPVLLLAVALGCGMVAAVAVSKTMMEKDGPPQSESTADIFIATREIKTASQITADKIKLEKWPKSRIPEGAISKLEGIEGKFARQGIFPGEPILQPKLADSNSSLSTQIPAGHTLFDIVFDNNYIKPGDIVDITGTFTVGNMKKPEIRTVLKGVQVFAINGDSNRDFENKDKGGRNTTFQLLIKQTQHQALLLANNIGKLELNLRPLGGDGNVKDLGDDGESFISWAEENKAASEADSLVMATSPPILVSTPNLPVAPPKAKSEMVIITPLGYSRWEYSDNELPREIKESSEAQAQKIPSNPWGSSSGYGGYTPNYPSATPSTPANPGPTAPDAGSDPQPESTSPATGIKPAPSATSK
ncbi:MAG: Flp pilus assembly protein CpaB [Pirellulaceae bacterium]|nr:Flp pilus assembly protein CpaB [Pirellulaceae bacterium]